MAKLVLDTIAKFDEISKINSNFDKIEAEFQNKVLYRNNPVGEPNSVASDIDLNNKNVLNANEIRASDIFIDGVSVTTSVQTSQAAAAASATAAASSATSAASNASAAATSASQAAAAADFIPEIANYAALRAYSGSITEFHLKGHTSVLDGGAGVFRVDAADTTSADNGGTILVDVAGRRWKREFSGAFNVRWFGAKGDNIADDSTSFANAISAIPAFGGEIFVPRGDYKLLSGLILPESRKIRIFGEGESSVNEGFVATVLRKPALSAIDFIVINTDGSIISDLNVQGDVGNTGDGIVIKASRVTLRNVAVYKMGNDGIRIGTDAGGENCNLWLLDNCKSKHNVRNGLYLSEGAGALADANAGTCIHPDFQSNGQDGVSLNGSQLNTFIGGAYQQNGRFGVSLSQYAKFNVFFGGDIEGNISSDVRIDNGATGNAFYNYTMLFSQFQISNLSDNNRIECIDHNRVVSGIKFPPTQVPSSDVNTLDDYEEGTFTPIISGTSTAGAGTYTAQVGRYTKIGRVVNFTINIIWTAHTGTGNTEITGLPFSSANTANTFEFVTIAQNGGPVPGAGKDRIAFIQPNTSKIALREFDPATAVMSNSNAIASSGTIYTSGSYTV